MFLGIITLCFLGFFFILFAFWVVALNSDFVSLVRLRLCLDNRVIRTFVKFTPAFLKRLQLRVFVRISLEIPSFRVNVRFLYQFLLINEIIAMTFISQEGKALFTFLNLTWFRTTFNPILLLSTLFVFILQTPFYLIIRKSIRLFCLVRWWRNIFHGNIFWFFNTLLEEHDVRNLLEVELIFNRESFKSIFLVSAIFIFRLNFNALKNIWIRDRGVIQVECEVLRFHFLAKIQLQRKYYSNRLQLGNLVLFFLKPRYFWVNTHEF